VRGFTSGTLDVPSTRLHPRMAGSRKQRRWSQRPIEAGPRLFPPKPASVPALAPRYLGAKAKPILQQVTPTGPPPPAAWLRAIIQAVGTGALTLDEIQRAVGEIILTPETAALDEYVEVLIQEGALADPNHTQHFELTEAGRTLLEGVLTSPSTIPSESSAVHP
jgi:hypothetical protein